uniref:Uncharacterized protein n=1 Tax=Ditylenchus dipsaci TaxID=166011 RepID=A0A915E7C4_9BILA
MALSNRGGQCLVVNCSEYRKCRILNSGKLKGGDAQSTSAAPMMILMLVNFYGVYHPWHSFQNKMCLIALIKVKKFQELNLKNILQDYFHYFERTYIRRGVCEFPADGLFPIKLGIAMLPQSMDYQMDYVVKAMRKKKISKLMLFVCNRY